jgi:hypothetical protein
MSTFRTTLSLTTHDEGGPSEGIRSMVWPPRQCAVLLLADVTIILYTLRDAGAEAGMQRAVSDIEPPSMLRSHNAAHVLHACL